MLTISVYDGSINVKVSWFNGINRGTIIGLNAFAKCSERTALDADKESIV